MANLKIDFINYYGDKYFYESPKFENGLNIIEGHNGSGKSTLMNLIYYCLGGTVLSFTEEIDKQDEIFYDTNNFVELGITIGNNEYNLKRYINNNTIAISYKDEIKVYPVYRQQEDPTFSDWILTQLEIDVFSVYQGNADWKINFLDLMRLIYHDQSKFLGEIYKKPDKKMNLVNNAPVLKKAIFEVLIGHNGDTYYKAYNKLKELEKEKSVVSSSFSKYKEVAETLRESNHWDMEDINSIQCKIDMNKKEFKKLEIFKKGLRTKSKNTKSEIIKIEELKNKIILSERSLGDLNKKSILLYKELKDINEVHIDTIKEIDTIEKILYTHSTFDLFHPTTCPICLKEASVESNKCICGKDITGELTRTIFYNSDEYLDLLKSNKKSLDTIEVAKSNCLMEIDDLDIRVEKTNIYIKGFMNELNILIKEIDDRFDNSELIKVERDIILISNKLNSLLQQNKVEEQLSELFERLETVKELCKTQNKLVYKLAMALEKELSTKLVSFNKYYNELVTETLDNCKNAYINSDYFPVINGGSYREASSIVSTRLMYYISLLQISLDRDDVSYPRFLIIDTPETAGIDLENLINCISQLSKVIDNKKNYQVILTTGLKKYPDCFSENVRFTIEEGNYLLQKRTLS